MKQSELDFGGSASAVDCAGSGADAGRTAPLSSSGDICYGSPCAGTPTEEVMCNDDDRPAGLEAGHSTTGAVPQGAGPRSVYVDACEWPYGRMMMCHMVADCVEDLHAMADRISVSRRWFQDARYPHYDICKSKRKLAVGFGAVEIDRRQFVEIAHRLMR